MSEPKTDTFDRLKRFMAMSPNERDEALFLQSQRFKSILESEGVMDNMRDFAKLLNGTKDEPGISVRLKWNEQRVNKLVASNAKLQAAMYVCTGIWLAVKFYFDVIHKP